MDCSPPGSAHGLLQARILEWVASSSSRGSSQPRDRTLTLPAFTGEFLATSATWEALTPLGPYFWTLCTLKWASANWPSAVSGACITLSLHLWVQHAAPLQGCLCVILYPYVWYSGALADSHALSWSKPSRFPPKSIQLQKVRTNCSPGKTAQNIFQVLWTITTGCQLEND